MDVKQELEESLKKLNKLQQELEAQNRSLEGQIGALEEKIGKFTGKLNQKNIRLELLACFCLLSELCSGDFDRMIGIREKFQKLLPQHFKEYLSYLEGISWQISWSGCFSCRHFSNRCNLNLKPVDAPLSENPLHKTCPSYVKRSPKV